MAIGFFKENTTTPSVKVLTECIPVVVINKDALIKMQLFVDNCDEEIGWLGTATREGNVIYVDDVVLFNQEVHATTTEITPDGLSTFGMSLLENANGVEMWNNIRLWGHSHVNMGTFASGQDDNQMKVFKDCGHDWFLRIIANKKGEIRLDLYEYNTGIIYNTINWLESSSKEEQELMAQIEELTLLLNSLNNGLVDKYEENVKSEILDKVVSKSTIAKKNEVITINNNYNKWQDYRGTSYLNVPTYMREEIELEKEVEVKKKPSVVSVKTKEECHEENLRFGIYASDILDEIYMCRDAKEVRQVLEEWDLYDVYTDEDLLDMIDYADRILYN